MTSNPTDGIRLMQFDEVTKAILSLKEIQKLAITPCPNNEVKRAFLFSCYCGLRWCDVHQLQYKDIDFSSNRLTILQQKVQSHSKNAILHLNLNHTAIKLLQRHKGINEELVFGLPSYSYTLRILGLIYTSTSPSTVPGTHLSPTLWQMELISRPPPALQDILLPGTLKNMFIS